MSRTIWGKIEKDIRERYGDDVEYKTSMLVAANIARAIKKQGVTKAEVSKNCGLTLVTLKKYLSGNADMKLNTITRIAHFLQTTTYELLKPYKKERPQGVSK